MERVGGEKENRGGKDARQSEKAGQTKEREADSMSANRNIQCAALLAACAAFATATARAQEVKPDRLADELVLNFHLIHPGEKNNMAGDPNGCFFLDGRYHLHHLAEAKGGAAYAHVSSPDMLHWQWHRTPLTPAFTGPPLHDSEAPFDYLRGPRGIQRPITRRGANSRKETCSREVTP
jgi:hypothetical protein